MAEIGVILLSTEGLVIAVDTPASAVGAATDSIRQIRNDLASILYSPVDGSDQFLQAYIAANQPLPAAPADLIQSLISYMTANHPASSGVGLAVVGLDPNAHSGFIVHEVGWNGQAVYNNRFPGDLFIGHHSIARYLTSRMRREPRSIEPAKKHAAFVIGETRRAFQHLVRTHLAMATIVRGGVLRWVQDDEIAMLEQHAADRSRSLVSNCVGLF